MLVEDSSDAFRDFDTLSLVVPNLLDEVRVVVVSVFEDSGVSSAASSVVESDSGFDVGLNSDVGDSVVPGSEVFLVFGADDLELVAVLGVVGAVLVVAEGGLDSLSNSDGLGLVVPVSRRIVGLADVVATDVQPLSLEVAVVVDGDVTLSGRSLDAFGGALHYGAGEGRVEQCKYGGGFKHINFRFILNYRT